MVNDYMLEQLNIHTMASGHLCINLTESVGWDHFPQFAEELIGIVGGKVCDKSDSVEMRIWLLQFPTCQIRLVYEDFPLMVSLESDTLQGDDVLKDIVERLKGK